MPLTSDGIVQSTSPNKITPVETDLAPTAAEPLEEPPRPEGEQDLVELAQEELAKPSEEAAGPGTAGSQGRTEETVGGKEEELPQQEGLDNPATQVVGVLPEDIEPPELKSRSEPEVNRDNDQLRSQHRSSVPLRGGYTVVSSSSDSSDTSSGYQAQEHDAHRLTVAVTPDGKVITGKCLTYEDGRGGALASNFFVKELHYSSANPNYHKRRGRNRCGTGGCTVA